jgi:hypothetical protein
MTPDHESLPKHGNLVYLLGALRKMSEEKAKEPAAEFFRVLRRDVRSDGAALHGSVQPLSSEAKAEAPSKLIAP